VSLVRRILGIGLTVLVLGGLAYALWPARFGGRTIYVVVRGESMEPKFHKGDLLFARKSDDFEPGDIAVYRIPKGTPGAGALVVHRIKRVLPNGTYIFQGDNRKSPDDATPTRENLIAKPVKNLGPLPTRTLVWLPILFTLIAAIAVTIAVWPDRSAADDEAIGDGEAETCEADPDDEREPVAV
jgi:signal peptidase I